MESNGCLRVDQIQICQEKWIECEFRNLGDASVTASVTEVIGSPLLSLDIEFPLPIGALVLVGSC